MRAEWWRLCRAVLLRILLRYDVGCRFEVSCNCYNFVLSVNRERSVLCSILHTDMYMYLIFVTFRKVLLFQSSCIYWLGIILTVFFFYWRPLRPPLWSGDQSSWLQIQRSRVRFPVLPDFLRSSGSGAGVPSAS
jgi:hypothetical protein